MEFPSEFYAEMRFLNCGNLSLEVDAIIQGSERYKVKQKSCIFLFFFF